MNKAIVVFLNQENLVNKIVEEGFMLNDSLVTVTPLSTPLTKVILSNIPPFINNSLIERELSRYGKIMSPIKMIPLGCKNPEIKHVMSFRRQVFVLLDNPEKSLNVAWRFNIEGRDYVVFASTEVFKCFLCGEQGHLKRTCPKLQTEAGTSSRNDDGEAAAVVQRAEVEEPPRPEPRPRRKRPEEPGTSAAAAEPGAAAPSDADKEGVYAAVIKKRKLKKRTSAAADPAAGEEESVWGPITVSHDSGVGSQPSAVVEPSTGSEGQEKGGPQPANLLSEDSVQEGSDVGGDSLGAQAGPVDVPPSDETPQPAGSIAEMPAADGDSAGEEEDGSAGSEEDGWEDGLSDTSQLSDITASQRGKLYSPTEISDFLEKTKDRINRESVHVIERGIFTVCLDAPVMRLSEERYTSRMAAQMLHGGGTYSNSGNRWFDKTLQFIVGEDGACGLIYEQATAEGPPIATLVDHVLDYCQHPETVRSPMVPLPLPKKLYFYITPEIKRDIEHAKQNLDILINDLDIRCFTFREFGKNFPKKYKLSPDSFIQVALQLAYYRMYGCLCSTCESASLRMFRGGRTDTIRSATNEALRFVEVMEDPQAGAEMKLALLKEAIEAHSTYTEQALQGQAIDRHLLGLKLQAIEEGLSVPEIFMDTSYAMATHWKLHTGQVSARTDCVMCFGPMVPDGYAVCYNPLPEHINFSVSAFNCCAETNAEKLARSLEQSLRDLQELVLPRED